MKLFIDCDPGVDDSLAIMFALARPDVEIVGISTSVGNVTAKQGADNALRILKLAGKEGEIPVCVGAEAPLMGGELSFPDFIHGKNGIGDVELPESGQKPEEKDVCEFIYEKACEYEGELVLLTLGRMTNIANVLKRYPDFYKKIKRVVAMGGMSRHQEMYHQLWKQILVGIQKQTDIVVQVPWDLTMVGLDVTLKTTLRKEDIARAIEYCREECKEQLLFLQKEMKSYMQGARRQNWMQDCCPLHDPLAMIVAVDPSVVKTQRAITRIECGGTYCRGMVVTDVKNIQSKERFVTHCMEVDSEKVLKTLFAAFQ